MQEHSPCGPLAYRQQTQRLNLDLHAVSTPAPAFSNVVRLIPDEVVTGTKAEEPELDWKCSCLIPTSPHVRYTGADMVWLSDVRQHHPRL